MMLRTFSFYLTLLILAGCQSADPGSEFAIKPAWKQKVAGLTHYSLANGFNIWVQDSPIVTGTDIKQAWYVTDTLENPAVMVEFDAAGTARMSQFSSGHLSQPLAVFVQDELISAPLVIGTLGSEYMIMGIGSKAQAEQFIRHHQADPGASD